MQESYRRGKRQPWDLQRPQREVINAEVEGLFSGDVLDAGCGLGDNAAFLAAKGYQVKLYEMHYLLQKLVRSPLSGVPSACIHQWTGDLCHVGSCACVLTTCVVRCSRPGGWQQSARHCT